MSVGKDIFHGVANRQNSPIRQRRPCHHESYGSLACNMAWDGNRAAIEEIDKSRVAQHQSISLEVGFIRLFQFSYFRRDNWSSRHNYRITIFDSSLHLTNPRASCVKNINQMCAAERFWAEWRSKKGPVGWLRRVPKNPGCAAGGFACSGQRV